MAMAPLVPRHYVVMEVKQNLVASDRAENLKRFNMPHFKKIAKVMMGEPKSDYKARVHVDVLKDKQQKSDAEWRKKKAEKERKKAAIKRQKELEARKAAAAEEAKKRKEGEEAKEGEKKEEEKKDVEMKTEDKKVEKKDEKV